MAILMALVIGVLYAAGLYLMMRRSIVKLIIGIGLLSHAANLLIFTAAGLRRAGAPIVPPGADAPLPGTADPVPQALILTAIVIGFAVQAFTVILIYRVAEVVGVDDVDALRTTDA